MVKTRVLIVDDEEDFASALAERMRTRGLEADCVFSGDDALKAVKEKVYDSVVLDLAMPGMDGMATLRAMLQINADLQVIILTGQATVAKSVEAVKEGAFEFLEKPIKLDDLVGKIDQARTRTIELTENKMNDMIDELIKRRGW
ncbi:MAG TPA: response regulator [candidate division Zixibacteria bacterium]|nr:response regulator [candidate division Zixibacteria bacterium]